MENFKSRIFAKVFCWRVVAATDTFLLAVYYTGKLSFAGTITLLEILTKTFLYYFHERGWNKIKWGRI